MTINWSNNQILSKKRKGTIDDPFVSIEESLPVINGKTVLTEAPNRYEKVNINYSEKYSYAKNYTVGDLVYYEVEGEKRTFECITNCIDILPTSTNYWKAVYFIEVENNSKVLNKYEYYVDYLNGVVYHHEYFLNYNLIYKYLGEGVAFFPASKVWTKAKGFEVLETLQELIDDASLMRDIINNLNNTIDEGTLLNEALNDDILTGETLHIILQEDISLGDVLNNTLINIINSAETIKVNLDSSINDANTINTTLSDPNIGTIKRATDKDIELNTSIDVANTSKTNLDNSVNTANSTNTKLISTIDSANITDTTLNTTITNANTINNKLDNEVDGTIKRATDKNIELDNTINTANTSKANLDGSINTANTSKTNLDNSITNANTINNTLDNEVDGTIKRAIDKDTELNNTIASANTSKANLDSSINIANTSKTDLDGSINTANTMNINLTTTVDNAESIKYVLDEKVEDIEFHNPFVEKFIATENQQEFLLTKGQYKDYPMTQVCIQGVYIDPIDDFILIDDEYKNKVYINDPLPQGAEIRVHVLQTLPVETGGLIIP